MPPAWNDRPAFTAAAGTLSFAMLREAALRMAGWLGTEAGVGRGDRVAVCLPKSLEAITSIYGVLAAGAAYVGLQQRGPLARTAAILAAADAKLLLTTRETLGQVEQAGLGKRLPPAVCVEAEPEGRGLEAMLRRARPLATPVAVGPDELAAIVFTSGSTGEPKGVMLSHRNMLRDVAWMVGADEMGADDLRLSQVPLHYISPHLFQPPLAGSRVHLLTDEDNMFPDRVAAAMAREGVTVWAAASTALRLLVDSGALRGLELPKLRLVKSHGEPMPMPVLRAAMAALPQARFSTTYGASEAPDITHLMVPRPLPPAMTELPLGTVQSDYRLLICDEAGTPLPDGETGEICCTGPGVFLGYWRDEALTASKRLDGRTDSFRTGDLGRRERDGTIRFLGRANQLVKLRGHRFDLGEVEAVLKRHAAVREAIALLAEPAGDEPGLLAAIETDDPRIEPALMQLCAERLPRFAWPARLLFAAGLPRLANGKIDRQALLAEAAPRLAPRERER